MPNLAPQNTDQWMRAIERRLTRLEHAGQPSTVTPQRIILPGDPDAQVDITNQPPLQIGDSAGVQMRLDSNEIQTGNNGAASPLFINSEGGDVRVGNGDTTSGLAAATNLYLGSATNPNQPALRLLRMRTSPNYVGSTLYQQANDTPVTGLQVQKNGSPETTFNFIGGVSGTGIISALTGGTTRPITPFAFQLGVYTQAAAIAAGAGITQPISLAASRFTLAPYILVGAQTQRLTIDTEDITTSGFNLRAYNFTTGGTSAGAINIWWLAIQMTSSSVTG